jgi:hypothetical protein
MSFELLDVVRVARLIEREREVDGSSATPPQPRVGETGTVVEAVGEDVYLVERHTDDGRVLGIAEFMGAELALVERREGGEGDEDGLDAEP